MSDLPVRLCCFDRHSGVMCPDGKVMCCLCFERVETTDLASDFEVVMGKKEWHVIDVCKPCYEAEQEAIAATYTPAKGGGNGD